MNGKNRLNGFNLDDYEIIDKHVNPVAQLNRDSFVDDGKDLLTFNLGSHSSEFITEAFTIGPFEQSRAQSRVHAIRGTQNAVGCFTVYQPCSVPVRVRVLRVSALG